ncbi:MAG: c-type cytochrome, partial [Gammaproteobacteria bacterium]|nr:c-type cytochrome [Gammaproteobacteria bacterium]
LPMMAGDGIITAEGEIGKAIFAKYNCRFCHNDENRNDKIFISKTAVIGGQNKAYLYKSLKDIQQDVREADQFNLMERVLNHMTDDQIRALAEYLSALK